MLARGAHPFFRRTSAYRVLRGSKIDTIAEIALYFVTDALTTHGTEFDPAVDIRGYADFLNLCTHEGGVLLIQPHAVLTHLQFRRFYDDGLGPIGVNADALMRIAGTNVRAELVLPSANFLLSVRNRLREGRLVCAMVDRGEHSAGRTVEFETARGPIIVAPALFQVALRCGAKVAFTEVHVEGLRVVGTITIPSSETVDGLTNEFADFVRRHVTDRPAISSGRSASSRGF